MKSIIISVLASAACLVSCYSDPYDHAQDYNTLLLIDAWRDARPYYCDRNTVMKYDGKHYVPTSDCSATGQICCESGNSVGCTYP